MAHYRRLIGLRHEVPAVALDAFELLLADDEQVWACTRRPLGVELQPPDRSGDVRGSLMADRCSREVGVGTSMSVPVVHAPVLVHRMEARQGTLMFLDNLRRGDDVVDVGRQHGQQRAPVGMSRDRAYDAAGPELTGLALAGSGHRWLRRRRTA